MHTAIGQQTNKMNGFVILSGIFQGACPFGVLIKLIFSYGLVDPDQILIHNPAGPDVHVTYL